MLFIMKLMIYCFYGSDSYRRGKKLREVLNAYRKKHASVDMFEIDLEENPETWEEARDFLNQPSMFVDSKVLVVRESGTVDRAEWVKALKAQIKIKKTFVIISDEKKPNEKFLFLLKEPVRAQEFQELKGTPLEKFLNIEACARGIAFERTALRFFTAFVDAYEAGKSWFGISELEKLVLLKKSSLITLADLKAHISIFERDIMSNLTRNMLFAKNKSNKLVFLERLFLQRESPSHIFNLLGYQTTGEKTVSLADYDVLVKSGKLDYEEALLGFVLK